MYRPRSLSVNFVVHAWRCELTAGGGVVRRATDMSRCCSGLPCNNLTTHTHCSASKSLLTYMYLQRRC